MLIQLKRTAIALVATAGLIMLGCAEKAEDEDKTEEEEAAQSKAPGGSGTGATPGVITMSGSLALAGTALTESSLGDLILYCITFETPPVASTSGFDTAGAFSVVIKANTPFGCFVNVISTSKTLATFVLETGISGGIGGGSATSLALSGDVALGALVISETGEIKIPAAVVADKKTSPVSAIDLDLVHTSTYKMECQDIGNATSLAQCKAMLENDAEPMTVYFRVLKGTKGDENVLGLGIWQDQVSFENCGSIDMSTAEHDSITSEGFVLSQVSAGTFAGDNCVLREGETAFEADNIQNYYAFNRLTPTAAGYSFVDEEKGDYGDCKTYHSTAIEFAGTTAEMTGAFSTKEIRSGTCGNDQDGNPNVKEEIAFFNVKFVKQ